ncbi:hypothetical protein KY285_033423 [Solanum tuberosum]|nr:hypothetical protein KY285_033423 [Solanum tuberosum]
MVWVGVLDGCSELWLLVYEAVAIDLKGVLVWWERETGWFGGGELRARQWIWKRNKIGSVGIVWLVLGLLVCCLLLCGSGKEKWLFWSGVFGWLLLETRKGEMGLFPVIISPEKGEKEEGFRVAGA